MHNDVASEKGPIADHRCRGGRPRGEIKDGHLARTLYDELNKDTTLTSSCGFDDLLILDTSISLDILVSNLSNPLLTLVCLVLVTLCIIMRLRSDVCRNPCLLVSDVAPGILLTYTRKKDSNGPL